MGTNSEKKVLYLPTIFIVSFVSYLIKHRGNTSVVLGYSMQHTFYSQIAKKKVVDVALECGYSSSQALAKVLKRELGTTAKELRAHRITGSPRETFQFFEKLAHPTNESTMEERLAQSMPSELVWYSKRGVKVIPFPDFDWDKAFEKYGHASTQLMTVTPVQSLDNKWKDMAFTLGDWDAPNDEQNYFIPEGYYFCCEVYLVNNTAYMAAIDGLFRQVEEQGYVVDETGFFIEVMRNVGTTIGEGATFSFQIPIIA